ncbi:hypothetical protein LTR05_002680 [Lithohypha guttulata]|uniref:Uncharacterized protein n=1 Tax=Lithohypha guttulata TaxID=1690604 RepID=A0AAN7T2M5_9EURO|nr:hypothetical protein LTR05_002680 [Lithohypha guttulata]
MNKPIVGPDPASALLALKLRMDTWRVRSVDNLAELYQYAKAQGYGDLGDMQLFLSNHLRGLTSPPTGYKLVSHQNQPVNSTTETARPGSKKSVFKRFHDKIRGRRAMQESDQSIEMTSTPAISIIEAENVVMSGAISPSEEVKLSIGTTTSANLLNRSSSASGHERQRMAPLRPTMSTVLRSNQRDHRTYSMPILPSGSIDNVSRELEKRSSWIQNLTKEHYQPPANTVTLSQAPPEPLAASNMKFNLPLVPPLPPMSPARTMAQGRRASLSLSRPPSPIMEEDLVVSGQFAQGKPPTLPPQNPRRFNVFATTIKDATRSLSKAQHAHTTPVSTALEVQAGSKECRHALLPSHVFFSCKTCGRLKSNGSTIDLAQPKTQAVNMKHGRSLSLDLERQRRGSEQNTEEQRLMDLKRVLELKQLERAWSLTRFPSLRKRDEQAAVAAPKAAEKPSIPLRTAAEKEPLARSSPSNYGNRSAPNLNTRPEYNLMQRPFPPLNSTPLQMTSSGGTSQTTASLTESPTELPTPVSVAEPYSVNTVGSSMGLVSSRNKEMPPVSILRAQGGDQGLLSRILANPKAIDGHRVPLDEMVLCTNDERIIDSILADISADSEPYSTDTETSKWPYVRQETYEADLHDEPGSMTILTTAESNDRVASKDVVKKSLRNSLRLWSMKKSTQVSSPIQDSTQTQANVLILDSSGSFSTLASPIDDGMDYWQEKMMERARTPMCELP